MSTDETMRRLGAEPRYEVVAKAPESVLVDTGGRRRRRRWEAEVVISVTVPDPGWRGAQSPSAMVRESERRLRECVDRLTLGRVSARWDLSPLTYQPTEPLLRGSLRLRFIADEPDQIRAEATRPFADAFAPHVLSECDRVCAKIAESARDAHTVEVAGRYLDAIVTEARNRARDACSYAERLDALRAECDAAAVLAVSQIEASDELRTSLAEAGEEVDERALRAAYRLAAQRVAGGHGRAILSSDPKLTPEDVFGGAS